MKETIELVQSVGFPIVIALLFYIDLRKVVRCNTKAINALVKQQARLVQVLRRLYLTYSGRVNMNTNRAPANPSACRTVGQSAGGPENRQTGRLTNKKGGD